MKNKTILLCSVMTCLTLKAAETTIPNRLIDYRGYLKVAQQVEQPRERRRLTEAEFLALANQPGTILLDARSAPRFKLRHIRGAINLPFTEFTAETLAKAIPNKTARVLIYCNNNFLGSPQAFATKAPAASLNISTYVTLTTYGYTNIYELGPLIDVNNTRIIFEGEEIRKSY